MGSSFEMSTWLYIFSIINKSTDVNLLFIKQNKNTVAHIYNDLC